VFSLFFAPFALGVAALLAAALAFAMRRRRVAGGRAFFWLMIAAAEWSTFSMLHWIAASYNAKFLFSQLEYIGIATVPPLWFLFAADYGRRPWARRRDVVAAVWTIPVVTILVAVTARFHGALWTDVIVTGPGSAEYRHGWWFWVCFAYAYALLAGGTSLLMSRLRQAPPYRPQLLALLMAALIPWVANVAYITGFPALGSLDPTPISFAASGLLITWALYRAGLFDLVPIARDQLVDSLTDPVLVVDPARRVLDMNSAARRIATDIRPWLGAPVDALFPFLSGATLTRQSPGADGVTCSDTSYNVKISQVQSRGEYVDAWLVLLHDVTEQRRTDVEREALVRQKTEFVATVSHEMRTPMFAIQGSLQLVLSSTKTTLANEDRKLLSIALSTTDRLVRIVNDLLDLSAIEAQQFSLRRDVVPVDGLIADALSDVSQVARQASIHLQSGMPLGPPAILGDRDRLIQALVNLLSNAIKVSPADSVVTCRAYEDGEMICIAVEDRGPGISHDVMHKLFERYQQLDVALSRRAGGTGLGLAITKALVEQHGGHIRVESTPGEGSTFSICIPKTAEPAAISAAPHTPAPARTPAPVTRPNETAHVLVADDEPDVREVLVEALRRRGYAVSTAANGEEAVAALRRGAVDVAVLDLHMPQLNGYDVIRFVRTESSRPNLPIVVLTGAVDQLDSLELLGANTLLAKPTDIRRLITEVDALVAAKDRDEAWH
jgi:signal transduction histidine kinase/ActR/RegA family two-component response regulator